VLNLRNTVTRQRAASHELPANKALFKNQHRVRVDGKLKHTPVLKQFVKISIGTLSNGQLCQTTKVAMTKYAGLRTILSVLC